ncbi:MAG: Lpg1974 family pore-forming outer membrane protein [Lacipirellulaceae bacterium]
MRTRLRRLAVTSVALLAVFASGITAEAQNRGYHSGLLSTNRTKASPAKRLEEKQQTSNQDSYGEASDVVFATDSGSEAVNSPSSEFEAEQTIYSDNLALSQYYSPSDCNVSDCNGGSCSSGYCDMNSSCGCDTGCCEPCCDDACCDTGCCDSACCGCIPECCPPGAKAWKHRTRVWGEFLYLQPGDADVSHAQQQNGLGGAGTVPFGTIGRVDPDFEPGFRVGADFKYSDRSSVFVSYTQYESAALGSLSPVPGNGTLSLIHHPGALTTASAGPLVATYDIDFQLADFGVRRLWKCGCDFAINWSLGGRYGHLEQGFYQSGIYAAGVTGQVDTISNVDFDGGGVRAGLDGEYRFGCHGFSLYGNVNVSPMIGTVQADYTMRNVTTDQLLALAVWKDDRFITTLDYEAGIAWTSAKEHFRVSAGWNSAHWFNAVTTDSFINGVQGNNYVDIDGPLSFSGLSTRVEYRF